MTEQTSLFGSDDDAPSQKGRAAQPNNTKTAEPLASRMRPQTLDEIVGQEHLVGPGRLLRRTIESDRLTSIILWGPPGSGKTTLAEVIAHHTRARFMRLSAVSAGVADLRKVMDEASKLRQFSQQRTILFIDEIHRFNKAQQDAVLPYVERGVVTLIGATTENPSFEVIAALLSRCRVFTLKALSEEQVQDILRHALTDAKRGLGAMHISIDDDVLEAIAVFANGDARTSLNVLELAAQGSLGSAQEQGGQRTITLALVEEVMQHRALLYDKGGDQHYDTISALHKSLRGSDPDASLYWLARMVEAGEDPLYIVRRLIRFASEDVGMADPQALKQSSFLAISGTVATISHRNGQSPCVG